VNILAERLELEDRFVNLVEGPLDLTMLFKLYELEGYDDLKYKEYHQPVSPKLAQREHIFEAIRQRDILLHHPYESFDPIVEMIREAAKDPRVLASSRLFTGSAVSPP
jgi:polyphosphate kinase